MTIKDGPVLFYCKDGVLYPVALTSGQQFTFEFTCRLLSSLHVVQDRPVGKAVNLLGDK